MKKITDLCRGALALCVLVAAAGCTAVGIGDGAQLRAAPTTAVDAASVAPDYLIGPLDQLEVFVWRAPELSTNITVRPDGRISTPLVEDMVASEDAFATRQRP